MGTSGKNWCGCSACACCGVSAECHQSRALFHEEVVPSEAGVAEVERSLTEVEQVGLEINGLHELFRLGPLAFLRGTGESAWAVPPDKIWDVVENVPTRCGMGNGIGRRCSYDTRRKGSVGETPTETRETRVLPGAQENSGVPSRRGFRNLHSAFRVPDLVPPRTPHMGPKTFSTFSFAIMLVNNKNGSVVDHSAWAHKIPHDQVNVVRPFYS